MNKRQALGETIPHTGRGKWITALVAGFIALVAVIWYVAAGFRGRHISRNAAALTEPVAEPAKPAPAATQH